MKNTTQPMCRALSGTVLRSARAPSAILALVLFGLGLAACNEDPTGTDQPAAEVAVAAGPAEAGDDPSTIAASGSVVAAAAGGLTLPFSKSVTTTAPTAAFAITQTGTGPNGLFAVNNASSSAAALRGVTNGSGGTAVSGLITGSRGNAGAFTVANPASTGTSVLAQTNGIGTAVAVLSTGTGSAGSFDVINPANGRSALFATTTGTGNAGRFQITNASSTSAALLATTTGPGNAAEFGTLGTTVQIRSVEGLRVARSGSGAAGRFQAFGAAMGVLIETQGGAGLQVVGGSKNAVVRTPGGAKALYTEESTEVWFTDYGFGRLQNGRARILFDPSFAQTINPEEQYHVFVQPYGRAQLYVAERTPLGFTVALKDGEPDAQFSYRIVAKRLGFESKRLEPAPWAESALLGASSH